MKSGINWRRDGGLPIAEFSIDGSPEAAGVRFREVLALIGPSVRRDDQLSCYGEADFGKDTELYLPSCQYFGQGVQWTTRVMIDGDKKNKPSATPGFVVGEYARFENFNLTGDCWNKQEDGCIIGWRDVIDGEAVRADYKVPQVGEVEFVNCTIDGRAGADWDLYAWVSKVKKRKITIKGCTLYVARIGVAACDGGYSDPSDPVQDVLIQDTKFVCDAAWSKSFGETSWSGYDPKTGQTTADKAGILSPVVQRSGRLVMRNVNAESTGLTAEYDTQDPIRWTVPRIAGLVTDQYGSNGQPVEATIEGCTSRITPNLAKIWNDIDIRGKGTVKVLRKEGSNPDGSLKAWSK